MGADREPPVRRAGHRHLDRAGSGGGDRGLGPLRRRQYRAYLGLVPTESSSGASRSQGSITKTGNTHARRLLVEAAWQQQRPLRPPSKALRARRDLVGPAVRARAQAADRRLHQRWQAMAARRKPPNKIAVAVARELAGWCWSLAVMPD